MLTDIFADRYEDTAICQFYSERIRRFMVQSCRMITEQLFPYYDDAGAEHQHNKTILEAISSKLAMELGKDYLSPTSTGGIRNNSLQIVKNFMQSQPLTDTDAEDFMKQRLSFVELAFREAESKQRAMTENLPHQLERHRTSGLSELARSLKIDSASEEFLKSANARRQRLITENIHELNQRLRQATLPLTYHNGFLQISDDVVINNEISQPFWTAITEAKWANVELDMLEALDRRDNRRPEAALSAAKALESTIKIIAEERCAANGKERGAVNFVEALASERGGYFISAWEANVLRNFFGEVRNRLGHGAGLAEPTIFTKEQDDWAISTCMSWIKSLVSRI